ncbi:MAG: endonuclease/exonuclease/phosphatase family protein [Actinomycetota bacterium]|nr:endonuclease/exonuclease/phosphatase family protein [Actinomycetota bacterium]
MRFRVATFNVHHCRGSDGRVDVARVAGVIATTEADLVALQELDRGMERSGGMDQPAELATLLQMEVAFFPTLHRDGGEYGIGIAARPGASDAGFHALPQVGEEEPRGVITAIWSGLHVACAHLGTKPRVLNAQVPALATFAAGLSPPAVVLGDLNRTARHLTPLLVGGFRGAFGHGTLPRRFPKRQIDHILVSSDIDIVSSWTLRTRASDHLPLIAELELTGSA